MIVTKGHRAEHMCIIDFVLLKPSIVCAGRGLMLGRVMWKVDCRSVCALGVNVRPGFAERWVPTSHFSLAPVRIRSPRFRTGVWTHRCSTRHVSDDRAAENCVHLSGQSAI